MTNRNSILRKKLNKKKKRTFPPLKGKCKIFGGLPGVELALFVAFDKSDENDGTKKFYSLRSKRNIPWLGRIEEIVSMMSVT